MPLLTRIRRPWWRTVPCEHCKKPIILGWSMYRSAGDKFYHTEKSRDCLKAAGIPFNQSAYE